MVEPRFRWTFAEEFVPSEEAVAAAAARGISTRLAGLLAARGAVTAEDLIAWFAEPLEGLQDRVVDDVREGLAGMARLVLADPVEDHDRVVDGEADDREHRGHE